MNNPARAAPVEPVKNATLIAGPTASGKSAYAAEIARKTGGVIVNADSMQVYSVLRVLTARPGPDELAAVPHLLYGHVDPSVAYSTGRYVLDVEGLVRTGAFEGRPPVFAGGTGLYFRALLDGLSAMPEIPAAVRTHWRARLADEGPEALHAVLTETDPKSASVIRPSDGQRIVRALEVFEASGRPISDWQREAGRPLVDRATARLFVFEPDRAALTTRIERRFDRMIEDGALEEARALGALKLDPAMPAMKAIGVQELLAADRGEMTPAEAIGRSKIATRQYAKRQSTWFRNQLGPEWLRIGSFVDEKTSDEA